MQNIVEIDIKLKGLNSYEVAERKRKGLVNNFVPSNVKSLHEIIISNSLNIFNIVNLSVFGVLYYFYARSGDSRLLWDSVGLFGVTILNTAAAIYQELKAASALSKIDLLKDNAVRVFRDGEEVEINKYEIVRDDLIKINSGDQVLVDGVIIHSEGVEIDESNITGESIPIHKAEGDDLTSGSYCISGSGVYKAVVVGSNTFAAKLTKSVKKYEFKVSPLQRKINVLFVGSFAVTIVLVALEIIINFTGTNYTVDDIRKVSTIAIALIPEGLVFFSTITFMLGILKIAKEGAIIQKVNALDSFANVKTACIDKTGTLTKNKLTIAKITALSEEYSETRIERMLGTYAELTLDKNATIKAMLKFVPDDSTELIEGLPFKSEYKFSAMLVNNQAVQTIFIFGAYDILIDKVINEQGISTQVNGTLEGYRNLMFGIIKTSGIPLDKLTHSDFLIEPVCIVSMKDEIRDETKQFIKFLHSRDIDVKYFTGDSSGAMIKILEDIGIETDVTDVVNGRQMDETDTELLGLLLKEKSVFTRLTPEQKHALIKVLQAHDKHVAFIGDGVNDLPALKEADLAISLEGGSSASKEVSDIVLLKNDLSVLEKMYHEGNRIINSVSFVAKLFLNKNMVVSAFSILSWFSIILFPFTPRNNSLVTLLGVSFPVYLISLKNKNTSPNANFLGGILNYTWLTSLVILMATFITYYCAKFFWYLDDPHIDDILISVLVIIFITNFIASIIYYDKLNRGFYIVTGLVLIVLYLILATTPIDFLITRIIVQFYEIHLLSESLFHKVLIIALPCSTLLFILHYLRGRSKANYS